MAVEIRVPPLGESVVEATVGRWTRKPGDPVRRDEILVELETDKITVEVAAPADGVLASVEREEGATVGVNDLLGTLEAGDAAGTPAEATPGAGKEEEGGAGPPVEAPPEPASGRTEAAGEEGPAAAAPTGAGHDEERGPAKTSPAARSLAAEHGLDLGRLRGSGPGGRITKEDVLRVIEEGRARARGEPVEPAPPAAPDTEAPSPGAPPAGPPPAPAGRGEDRERMSRRRQTIARRLVEAQRTTASLTTFNEVDLKAVMELRKARQDAFVERHGVKLGFMSFFTKAVIGGLRAFPRLNAEIQGEEIVLKRYYDVGIAVSAEEGLVVPVVRDADRMSFAEIERAIGELGRRARDGRLALEELQGGTFTITNGGIFGSMLSTPILNPPQVGILGMHNIVERPVAIHGRVEIRPMMYVALTYDHRIVDGSEAVRFLVTVKGMLEDPISMLLEG
jgi:2-oxoglutarate dehydrogenase E2 component (dihydrolipoamide succinyltransferase)